MQEHARSATWGKVWACSPVLPQQLREELGLCSNEMMVENIVLVVRHTWDGTPALVLVSFTSHIIAPKPGLLLVK